MAPPAADGAPNTAMALTRSRPSGNSATSMPSPAEADEAHGRSPGAH